MYSISASDARQELAKVIETAQQGPVMIQRQKRDVAVVLSVADYERLVYLNQAEFRRFCDQVGERAAQAGLTEEKLAALLNDDG